MTMLRGTLQVSGCACGRVPMADAACHDAGLDDGGRRVTELETLQIERRIDALLEPWTDRGGPGVTIGVVREGRLAVHRWAGFAHMEHRVPIGADTRFRIASVSKQFTCAAILLLAREGKLSLQDRARHHLPELPASTDSITVAQLMHNTAGIRDMLEIMRQGGADLATPVSTADLLAAICRQDTLNFEPGHRMLYSNSNFFLLGLIAERLAGVPLPSFLRERIFDRLGMSDTRLTPEVAETIPRLATGYLPGGDGGWRRAQHAFPLGGEGGLVSSVRDLALWARNLMGRQVGAEWLDGLTTQTPFANGSTNRYARGLVVRPYRGLETWSHGGLWPGYRTELLLVPAEGLAVIAIANTGNADPNLLAHRALDAVLEQRPGVPPLPPAAVPPPGLAGRYVDPVGAATLDVEVSDAGLVTLLANGVPAAAEAIGDGWFAAARSLAVFAVRATEDGLEVEQDAGVSGTWRRAPGGAALPDGLAGRYRSGEMAAEWTLAAADGRVRVQARGPVATGPAWDIEAVDGALFRVWTPGPLFRGWFDVRVCPDDGGLEVNGGRAKRVRYARVD